MVSTPIQDVLDLYGSVVEVADQPAEFVEAIERLWAESPAQQLLRREASRRLVAEHLWDEIVRGMRVQFDTLLPSVGAPDLIPHIASAPYARMAGAEAAVGDGGSD